MKKLLLFICFVCLTIAVSHATEPNTTYYSRIYFKLGESAIKNCFRDNEESLSGLDSILSTINIKELSKVKIIGSASPEGKETFNKQLSKDRANALQKHLSQKFNIPDTLFSMEYLGANTKTADNARNLRYAEVTAVRKTILLSSVKPKKQAITSIVEVKGPLDKNILMNYWWILILLLIFAVIVYIMKNRTSSILPTEIPSGNGGINMEGRTLGEISKQVFSDKHRNEIGNILNNNKELLKAEKEYNARKKIMGDDTLENLSKFRFGIKVLLPTDSEMYKILLSDPKTRDKVLNQTITEDDIRYITYNIFREVFAKKYNVNPDAIGKLDLAPHEAGGYIFGVPNNIHRWKEHFSHSGYASQMRDKINNMQY